MLRYLKLTKDRFFYYFNKRDRSNNNPRLTGK